MVGFEQQELINQVLNGEAKETLKKFQDEFIDCVVTSPPYWNLRNYQNSKQIGQEMTSEEFINNLCNIFDEIKRVLKPTGTVFVVIGDTYNKNKSLEMVPEKFAIEMINRGWILRNEIIWDKPNPKPMGVNDRFTTNHEKIYFFTKTTKYFFNKILVPTKEQKEGITTTGNYDKKTDKYIKTTYKSQNNKNYRTVWRVRISSGFGSHHATYPERLINTPIEAGCPEDGIVLDPFMGSGTTAVSALKLGRKFIGIELNDKYLSDSLKRIKQTKEYYGIE